jgi:hypothetical protein
LIFHLPAFLQQLCLFIFLTPSERCNPASKRCDPAILLLPLFLIVTITHLIHSQILRIILTQIIM